MGKLTDYTNPVSGQRGNLGDARQDLSLVKGTLVLAGLAGVGVVVYDLVRGPIAKLAAQAQSAVQPPAPAAHQPAGTSIGGVAYNVHQGA